MKWRGRKINIPYNKPAIVGKELKYIHHAHTLRQLAGDGVYTKKTQTWLSKKLGCKLSLLTHSATAALEMMAILSDIQPGDEVIMPSYTFVSTANAIVLRGGVPVFIDIRHDTLNMNEALIEQAITKRTKAIFPVHYAGVACEMDTICHLAKQYKLKVLEDAAQGFLASYKGKYLGTIGDMAAISFHETKNVISGEGGALLVNKPAYMERAHIVREKGTNRTKFIKGKVDKYTWVDIGSSYLPGEIVASFLMAQLEKSTHITRKRLFNWNTYHKAFSDLEQRECIRRPIIPKEIKTNGHIYYLLTRNKKERISLTNFLSKKGILAITHYVPLHTSPAGSIFGRSSGSMKMTDKIADCLIRLPIYYDMTSEEQAIIIDSVHSFFNR